jgi:hypothetical protein
MDGTLGGPQNRSGRGGEEKKFVLCPCQESNPGRFRPWSATKRSVIFMVTVLNRGNI